MSPAEVTNPIGACKNAKMATTPGADAFRDAIGSLHGRNQCQPPTTAAVSEFMKGNPAHRLLGRELQIEPPAEMPEPPPFLHGYGLDEWHRLADELHALGLLTTADVVTFAAYCQIFHHWREAEEQLTRKAEDDPRAGLLVQSIDGSWRVHPLVRLSMAASADMLRLAISQTLVARSRIASDPPPPRQRKV